MKFFLKTGIVLLMFLSFSKLNAQSSNRVYGEVVRLIEMKNWHQAKAKISSFYSNQPTRKSELDIVDAYEIGKLEKRVDVAIQQEESSYLRVKQFREKAAAEAYLANYPYGKYRAETTKLLVDIDEEEREQRRRALLAQEDNVYAAAKNANTIALYENYWQLYPAGRYVTEVKNWLEVAYIQEANHYYSKKSWSAAKSGYTTYLQKFPYGASAALAKERIGQIDKKMKETGTTFTGIIYDPLNVIGLSFGSLETSGAGIYFDLKTNVDFFTYSLWEIDNAGNTDRFGSIVRTGNFRQGAAGMNLGVTLPLAYPLWGYLGAGIGYFPFYEEVDSYSSSGDFDETEWMKNTDQTSFGFTPEAGFMIRLGQSAVLRTGVRYQMGGLNYQIGIAF